MLKVLMVGPARSVKGGMTTVVNNYFEYGLNEKVELKYIESCNDENKVSKLIQEIKGIHEFKKNIKNYDIVHIHMASRRSTYRKIKYIKIAKKYGKKVVLHIHGGGFAKFYDDECNNKQKEYIKRYLNMADKIIVLSEEWYDYFSKFIEKNKLEIVYNGVKVPEKFEKDLSNKNILFLGRINEQKGIYDLITAIKAVKEKYPNVCLYIGGSGEEEKISNLINSLDLSENVKRLGWIDNEQKDKILRECSVFALPSYFEAMPMSILEAMSYYCVTLSTPVGSIPKVIQDTKNGFLVDTGDIDKIADVINYIFENKKIIGNISLNARLEIEKKYNIARNIEKLLEIYLAI